MFTPQKVVQIFHLLGATVKRYDLRVVYFIELNVVLVGVNYIRLSLVRFVFFLS